MSEPTSALSVIRRPATLGGYQPPPERTEFEAMIVMANNLAKAHGFIPTHFTGQPYKVLAAILFARDLGLTATYALQHLFVVEGKVGMDGLTASSLIWRAGHAIHPPERVKGMSCTVRITRGDTRETFEETFTMDDARLAGLTNKDPWRKYPDAMLYWRALLQVARTACPDALGGVSHTAEELGADVNDQGEPIGSSTMLSPAQGDIPLARAAAGQQQPPPPQMNTGPVQDLGSAPVPSGVPEAAAGNQTIPTVAAIQPAPPAAPEGVSANAESSSAGVVPGTGDVPTQQPSTVEPTPPATPPDRSARSVGPKAKRTNVVPAQPQDIPTGQGATGPATAVEVQHGVIDGTPTTVTRITPDEPVQEAPHPVSLVDEEPAVAEEPDDGRTVYLASLRDETRKIAGQLHLLRVKLKNQKAALAGQAMLPEPNVAPNTDSDESLRLFIDSNFPSRTLADLRQGELENVLGVLQGLVDKIHQSGVKE